MTLDMTEMAVQQKMFTGYIFCWSCGNNMQMEPVKEYLMLTRCPCGAVGVIKQTSDESRPYLNRNIMAQNQHHPLCQCIDGLHGEHGPYDCANGIHTPEITMTDGPHFSAIDEKGTI
jgi:hypothetical protein